MAIVGKVCALDGESIIVDFKHAQKKVSNKLVSAKLGDFVVVRGNLAIEKLEKSEGKTLLQFQTALVKKLHYKKKPKRE